MVDERPKPTVVDRPKPTVVERPKPTVVERPKPVVVDRPTPTIVGPPTIVDRWEPWFHNKFRIIFERPGQPGAILTLYPGSILETVRIRWGRSNLFEAPMRRTMSFTANLIFDHKEMWNWRVLRVKALVDDRVLFTGQIDSIRLVEKRGNTRLLQFSATETPRWEPWLREVDYDYEWDIEIARSHASTYFTLDPLPIEPYPLPFYSRDDRDKVPNRRFELTGDQILRLAVAPYPASFVQFKPDGTVGCTMAANQAPITRKINSSNVEKPETWETRLEDTPFRVAMQSDRAWISEIPRVVAYFHDEAVRRDHAKIESFKDWGDFRRLDNGISFSPTAENGDFVPANLRPESNSFFLAADMIRGQLTSPQTMIFHDRLLPSSDRGLAFFSTWEEHENVEVANTDDLHAGPWRIIGGTLSIAHGHTKHETTVVWAKSHPAYGYPNTSDVDFSWTDNGEADDYPPF